MTNNKTSGNGNKPQSPPQKINESRGGSGRNLQHPLLGKCRITTKPLPALGLEVQVIAKNEIIKLQAVVL